MGDQGERGRLLPEVEIFRTFSLAIGASLNSNSSTGTKLGAGYGLTAEQMAFVSLDHIRGRRQRHCRP